MSKNIKHRSLLTEVVHQALIEDIIDVAMRSQCEIRGYFFISTSFIETSSEASSLVRVHKIAETTL